jgi:hypothetical protein
MFEECCEKIEENVLCWNLSVPLRYRFVTAYFPFVFLHFLHFLQNVFHS